MIILSIIIITIALVSYYYVFNIYEVKILTSSNTLIDNKQVWEVKAEPINALGMKVPFRYSPSYFKFMEGKELIEIIELNNEKGVLKFFPKSEEGKISIIVNSKYSLMPGLVEIKIKGKNKILFEEKWKNPF